MMISVGANDSLYREFEQAPCQTHDYFSKLPGELIHLCFDGLKKKDLLNSSRVCKQWYIKFSMSTHWKTHIIKRFGEKHPLLNIKTIFNKYCYIDLEKQHDIQTNGFASEFQNIQVTFDKNINDAIKNYNIIEMDRFNTLKYAEDVSNIAQMHPLNRIIELTNHKADLIDEVLKAISLHNKYLKAISFIESTKEPSDYNFKSITPRAIATLAASVPFLSHLVIKIDRQPYEAWNWSSSIIVFAQNCSQLQSFKVYNHFMGDEDLTHLSGGCPKLKLLHIEGTYNITEVGLAAIKTMTRLREFNVIDIDDELLPELIKTASELPRLESLTIKCYGLINSETARGVLNLSNTCTKLKKMLLSQHFDLKSIPEIHEWVCQIKRRLDLKFSN